MMIQNREMEKRFVSSFDLSIGIDCTYVWKLCINLRGISEPHFNITGPMGKIDVYKLGCSKKYTRSVLREDTTCCTQLCCLGHFRIESLQNKIWSRNNTFPGDRTVWKCYLSARTQTSCLLLMGTEFTYVMRNESIYFTKYIHKNDYSGIQKKQY